uniref:Si:ch211-137i24.10 n=1 Tax=Nothobranchius korthausae TaxID=1143690 RepID=A0A1A8FNH2_9TELE
MCTGKCSLCIAISLYPLVFMSILCNVLLFFPGWSVKYVQEDHITQEVKYMGGIIGGGVMVLITAFYVHLIGERGCCGNRLGMFFSIVFAAVGVAGAVYSFIVALVGLSSGPLCFTDKGKWDTPFNNSDLSYVTNHATWTQCKEPKEVVQFNIGLFISLAVASVLQALLCAAQVINGIFGCICGTCNKQVLNVNNI